MLTEPAAGGALEVGRGRRVALRAVYALMAFGGATISWAELLDPASHWPLMRGVVVCMLGAMSLLSLLGLRYPLALLPLLFWELAWKLIWLARIAWPAWRDGALDPGTAGVAMECALVVVVAAAIPWPYAVRRYLRAPAEPW